MFDHVVFGVSDYEASKVFFLKALEPIGLAIVAEDQLGLELSADGKSSLCIRKGGEKSGHLHLAFTANNRQQVEAFYRAALEAGGKDNGAPGLRPNYTGLCSALSGGGPWIVGTEVPNVAFGITA
jgi:catechol 2,3-dioxygenase-like lactoylglutathione lyase family enzyme